MKVQPRSVCTAALTGPKVEIHRFNETHDPHCRFLPLPTVRGRPAISEPHAARIFATQMDAIGVSGLAEATSKVIAMAASVRDAMAAAPFLPAKTMSIALGGAATELPTLWNLQVFAQNNPDWYIFYHHIKCATRSDNLCRVWRECMTSPPGLRLAALRCLIGFRL